MTSFEPRLEEPAKEQSDNYVTSVSLNKIADRIYEIETRRGTDLSGKHGRCVAQGKSNGYSYAPGTCYSNDEELRKIVINWLERKIPQYGIVKALDLYGGNSEYHNKFNL